MEACSMTRKVRGLADVAGEAALLAGGARAILLQVANPAVGRGVAEHSDFANRPLDRLTATLTYVYTVVYGTPEELAFVRRKVNAAHALVHDGGSGSPSYDAYDPELQLWVAATLYDTAVTLFERIFGPLPDATAEQVYREYAALGTALQMPAGLWPADRTEFQRYFSDQLARLRVDEATRRIADQLLEARALPFLLRPVMAPVRLVTAGLLDERLRREFRLPWGPRRQRRYDLLMGTLSAVVPRLPRGLRHALRDSSMRSMRRELAAARRA